MDNPLFVNETVAISPGELWFTASRSGGPGGQHVNKTSSKVTLHWSVETTEALSQAQKQLVLFKLGNKITDGILKLHVEDSRSQHKNKETALTRLAQLVAEALKQPKPRVKTKVSKGQKKRRLDDKKQRSEKKQLRKSPGKDQY